MVGQLSIIKSLSLSVLLAATVQLLVQLPGLKGTRLVPCLRFDHPAIRRILRLYAPVLLSIVVANLGILIDRRFASDRKSTRLNSSHVTTSRMPSSA